MPTMPLHTAVGSRAGAEVLAPGESVGGAGRPFPFTDGGNFGLFMEPGLCLEAAASLFLALT